MEIVTGTGGLFFRARDPEQLGRWYAHNPGVKTPPSSYEESPWHQEAGPTVFTPFPQNTEYFGEARQTSMINFRVRDIDAMVQQLRSAGIEVTLDTQAYPNGRFARLHDREDNPIESLRGTFPAACDVVIPVTALRDPDIENILVGTCF